MEGFGFVPIPGYEDFVLSAPRAIAEDLPVGVELPQLLRPVVGLVFDQFRQQLNVFFNGGAISQFRPVGVDCGR